MATDRSYVGRTSGYSGRISAHFSNLRKGVHSSRLMQSDFNEYGIDSFVVEVLSIGRYQEGRKPLQVNAEASFVICTSLQGSIFSY